MASHYELLLYFNSVMIACCFPLTNVSKWVRLRALKRMVPGVYAVTTDCPSGVVDFKSPSSRKSTTTSLSWKCMGVGISGVQAKSHTVTRSFSRSFFERGRGKARGYPLVLARGGTAWSLRSITIERPVVFGELPLGTNVALPENEITTASKGCAVTESLTSHTVTRSLSMAGFAVAGEPD